MITIGAQVCPPPSPSPALAAEGSISRPHQGFPTSTRREVVCPNKRRAGNCADNPTNTTQLSDTPLYRQTNRIN